jgi:hypothetical protein
MLSESHADSKYTEATYDLLVREQRHWATDGISCAPSLVQMAHFYHMKQFVDLPAFQAFLSSVWRERLSLNTSWIKVFELCFGLVLMHFFFFC